MVFYGRAGTGWGIPVTGVSNGVAGGTDLILSKAWQLPSQCRQWSICCLGDTNTCCNCNGVRRRSLFLLFEILKMSQNNICLDLLLLVVSGCEGDAHGTFDASISAKILTVHEIENLFCALSIPFDS